MKKTTIVLPTHLDETIVANAMASLREAGKESHSISGAIKAMGTQWSKGYDKAFAIFGCTKANLTPANIFAVLSDCQKAKGDEGQTICKVWRKEYDKVTTRSKNGGKVTTQFKLYKGKKVYRYVLKDIKAWSAPVLFELLIQAVNKGAMPAYPDYLAKYWQGVDAAKTVKQEVVPGRPISESKPKPIPTGKAKPQTNKKGGKKNGSKAA